MTSETMTSPASAGEVSPNNRPLLASLRHVDKVFGTDVVALKDMNLDIHQGDFISLLGPSGCGKSTALRIITGLMQPSRGKMHWEDPDAANNLGVVFQEPTLMPWATVEKNVYLPHKLKGTPKSKVQNDIDEVLELVGLDKFAGAYPRELSGGMKMRVSIARALATRPRLILMDEPFAALDEITRQKLNDDLLQLKAKINCTVIFVTHSVFESVFLSDRIVVMARRPGRVIEEIGVNAPYPRDLEFRTSAEYGEIARRTSDALLSAIGDGDDH